MLHKGLLCSHSPYFHNAFTGDFRESEEKAIHLPDVTASTLRIFQSWLYGQLARADPEIDAKKAKIDWKQSQDRQEEDTESVQAIRSESEIDVDLEVEMLRAHGGPPTWVDIDGE